MERRCEEIREHFVEFLRTGLPEDVKGHLKVCESCKEEWDAILELQELMVSAFPEREPSFSAESIINIARHRSSGRERTFSRWIAGGIFVAVCTIFIAIFLFKKPEDFSIDDEISISEEIDLYENMEIFENIELFENYGEVEDEGG